MSNMSWLASTSAALVTIATMAACHGHHAMHGGDDTAAATAPAAAEAPLTDVAIAIPIAPGRTAAWQAALAELIGPRYAEYDASRRRYGLTSQTTFLQRTPMGDFAVIHMTGADVRASFHAMETSPDPWDVRWRQMTSNLHGIDFASGKKVEPRVEPAYAMDDGAPRGRPFLFAVPLDAGGVPRFRALAREVMGARHADYVRARTALGIHREAVFLESTAQGDAAVFSWFADDPARSLDALVASTDPFDLWLRGEAAQVHPIGLDVIATIARANQLVAQYPHEPR